MKRRGQAGGGGGGAPGGRVGASKQCGGWARRPRGRRKKGGGGGGGGERPRGGRGWLGDLYENDNQGIERQRFDQHQAQQQGEADGGGSAGIARHAFGGGGHGLGLSQSAHTGSNRHGETGGDGDPVSIGGGVARRLAEQHRAGEQQQCQQEQHLLCHTYTPKKSPPGGGPRHPRAAGLTLKGRHNAGITVRAKPLQPRTSWSGA